MKFNQITGWKRLGIALSLAWFLTSSALYAENVGNSLSFGLPSWYDKWDSVFPFANSIPLFGSECSESGNILYASCARAFSTFGFLVFAFYPIALMWVLGYGIDWVKRGFSGDAASH